MLWHVFEEGGLGAVACILEISLGSFFALLLLYSSPGVLWGFRMAEDKLLDEGCVLAWWLLCFQEF